MVDAGTDNEMTLEMQNRHFKALIFTDDETTVDDVIVSPAKSPVERYEEAVADDDYLAAEAALRDMDSTDLAMVAEEVADEYEVPIKADITSDERRVRARILKVVMGDPEDRRKAAKQARYKIARAPAGAAPAGAAPVTEREYREPPVQRAPGGPGLIVSPGTSPETAASMARLLGVQPVVAQPVVAQPVVVPPAPAPTGGVVSMRVMWRAARMHPYGEKFVGMQANLNVQGNMGTLTDSSGRVFVGEVRKSAADNTELRLVLPAPVATPMGDVASLVLDLNRGTTASIAAPVY